MFPPLNKTIPMIISAEYVENGTLLLGNSVVSAEISNLLYWEKQRPFLLSARSSLKSLNLECEKKTITFDMGFVCKYSI